jgi:cytochrome c biogenesis protein CcdA
MRNFLFRKGTLFARGLAWVCVGLIWGFMPGLTIWGTPIDPRRYIVGLVIILIGAIVSIVGALRKGFVLFED